MSYKDEEKAVRNFVIIFVIVLLLAIGLYFFTKLVVKKESDTKNDTETKEVEIDNSIAIVGTMLNKVEDNYYVILYKSDDSKVSEYEELKQNYKLFNSKALYYVDLANALNSKYYDKDNTNYTAENINDLRFGDITVLEIKDKKIVKSYNDVDKIKKVWNIKLTK